MSSQEAMTAHGETRVLSITTLIGVYMLDRLNQWNLVKSNRFWRFKWSGGPFQFEKQPNWAVQSGSWSGDFFGQFRPNRLPNTHTHTHTHTHIYIYIYIYTFFSVLLGYFVYILVNFLCFKRTQGMEVQTLGYLSLSKQIFT